MGTKQMFNWAAACALLCTTILLSPSTARADAATHVTNFRVRHFFFRDPFVRQGFFSTHTYLYHRGYSYGPRIHAYPYGYPYSGYPAANEPTYAVSSPYESAGEYVEPHRAGREFPERSYLEPTAQTATALGRKHLQAGYPSTAAYFFSKSVEKSDRVELRIQLVQSLVAQGDYARAASHLRFAIDRDPVGVGATRTRRGTGVRLSEQRAALERQITRQSTDTSARLVLGFLYLSQDRPDAARQVLLGLLERDAQDLQAHDLLLAIGVED